MCILNRRYFILKSIAVNNLYGVDIMEEAVEICKLRLFLKLVAQVERVEDVEPLPDIDFNVRLLGNTLVGYATPCRGGTRLDEHGDRPRQADVRRGSRRPATLRGRAAAVERLFGLFRLSSRRSWVARSLPKIRPSYAADWMRWMTN